MKRFTVKYKHKDIPFILVIRALLMISIIITAVIIVSRFWDTGTLLSARIDGAHREIELLAYTILTYALTYIPSYMEKRRNIDLPDVLDIAIVIFIYGSIYLSNLWGLYYKFFWWDDFLHTLSGVIIGFIGFLFVYKINSRYSMNISPLLVAIIAFAFALTAGIIWEIFEFTGDAIWGTAMQKWNLSSDMFLIGKPYQGVGLRDTMSDIILDIFGALFTSTFCYFLFKNDRAKSLRLMEKTFPNKK